MIRRPPRSTQSRSSAASDVYKRQVRRVTGPSVLPRSMSGRFMYGSPEISRDRNPVACGDGASQDRGDHLPLEQETEVWAVDGPVSYTHLTLPTIYSV